MENFLSDTIKTAKYYLPEQGPLEYFVHHNTIHQFESSEFFEAVKLASIKYHTNAFLDLSEYQKFYSQGRISKNNLADSIKVFLKKKGLPDHTELLLKIFLDFKQNAKNSEITLTRNILQDELLTSKGFLKEYCDKHFHKDIDSYFSPTFLKFISTYFDFGTAYWKMEERKLGIWHCFKSIYQKSLFFESRFHKKLVKILKHYQNNNCYEIITDILNIYNISTDETADYLFNLMYRFKGWSALMKSLEKHPDWIKEESIKIHFEEYLAILMVLEYAAFLLISKNKTPVLPIETKYSPFDSNFIEFSAEFLSDKITENNLIALLKQLNINNCAEIWHYAYERNLYERLLSTYSSNLKLNPQTNKKRPKYQAFFCIDDREESLRRYLEQIDSDFQTFGVAGHFNLPIKFKGVFSRHYRALCPASITPDKKINEFLIDSTKPKSLSVFGELQWMSAVSSKTFARGIVQSFLSGFINILPFALDIFSPKFSAKIKNKISYKIKKDLKTNFSYTSEQNPYGFTLEERIQLAFALLKSSGLTKNFSPFVFFLGHGSSSLNNPHEAAHDCGACGGGRGWPNGRLIALILNEKEVRKGLKNLGIEIPEQTHFIGGYHNTCSDEIELYDLPKDANIHKPIQSLYKAAEFDAKERCRRFDDINKTKSYFDYTKGRSIDLTQPRPEYGHATNAFCLVGPRDFSKDCFLDRRAFLVSYDNLEDPQGETLNNILQSVGPVCAGINLEYYFSFIDNETYGCGTKLPHNVTSLLGVMNGHLSDLQLGLPWQMVEIHEPTRLFMIVYSKKSILERLLKSEGTFQNLVKNRWIELALHDSDTHQVLWYQQGEFTTYETIQEATHTFKPFDNSIFNSTEHLNFGLIAREES